ncbi:ricin-type beta-trefoil lectin domain protein [Streptosporangium sp. NPDC023615]|uniref:ricin-type beta-trefoil lectin domain protein n=1 Tax=Streptosporangium sp. NPDC023615 TaxID=3154794 RepID=UPI003424C7FE
MPGRQRRRTADGTAVIVWDCDGQNNQKRRLNADGTIVAVASGECPDVSNYGTANGSKIHIWTCRGGADQRWNRV